ncbi:MAG: hypothetical protein Q7R33_01660 [Nitrosarchaeum sp.]|nr:hypothetical protein [Nitrosarchaeum sp.]
MPDPVTVSKWLKKNLKPNATKEDTIQACMRDLKKSRSHILKEYNRVKTKVNVNVNVSPVGLSEADFRARHDGLFIIRHAVKQLKNDRLITDAEFREHFCKIDSSKFRAKSEISEFDKYHGRAKGVIYWSHPTTIEKFKQEALLS